MEGGLGYLKMKEINAFILAFIIIGLIGFTSSLSALSNQQNIGITVKLREWLILEVFTPSQTLRSAGEASAQITTNLQLEDNPIHIRVVLSVPHDQVVQLRVQANGDLFNSKGEIFPISNIAWHASGQGFQDGILSKSSSQIMATWVGPGIYEGIVNYYLLKSIPHSKDFTQTVTYSLVMP